MKSITGPGAEEQTVVGQTHQWIAQMSVEQKGKGEAKAAVEQIQGTGQAIETEALAVFLNLFFTVLPYSPTNPGNG
jgi:hypothetical protein